MAHPTRRLIIKSAAATVGAMSVAPHLLAQSAPVRVGYSMARTGPWTGEIIALPRSTIFSMGVASTLLS